MVNSYDDMQGTEQSVHDNPTHNFSDRVQLAGDVVPLPINPFQGSDRKSEPMEAASYAIGKDRGSDPKVRSIGNNTVLDWIDRTKSRQAK